MKNKFRKIATEVRKELIEIAPKLDHYGDLKNLGGFCHFGSIMLLQKFKELGFSPKIAKGVGHYFVVCDSLLIDITASQFGQGKICIRDYDKLKDKIASKEYVLNFWSASQLSTSPKDVGLEGYAIKIKKARKLLHKRLK